MHVVTLERACSLANEAILTIELQRRRLRSNEPEDCSFVFRWWADLQFLIVALRRLRRTSELASSVPSAKAEMNDAIKRFDESLPMLLTMRNVGEHVDDYALDSSRRRHKQVDRKMLQVGTWDGTTYTWLGETLNVDDAHAAAVTLYSSIRRAAQGSGERW